MKRKKTLSYLIAVFALASILLSIVWTGLLVIFSDSSYTTAPQELSPEQLEALISSTSSWEIDVVELPDALSGSWETVE